jgi:hypothetical protein
MTINEEPLDPARMFELMQSTRRDTQRKLDRIYAGLLFVWAGAWFIGFGALWFAEGVGGVPVIAAGVAWAIFGVMIASGIAWSIVSGIRSASSGIHGRSRLQGALYGYSWMISMVGAWLITIGLRRSGLSEQTANLLYPALFILMVGVMYLAGGAVWRSPALYALGVAMVVVASVATFIGSPWHFLIYATAGPAAMVVVGVMTLRGIIPAEPRLKAAAA